MFAGTSLITHEPLGSRGLGKGRAWPALSKAARPSSWGADFVAGRCASREQLKFHSPQLLSCPSTVPRSPRAACLPAGGHLKTQSCRLVPAG